MAGRPEGGYFEEGIGRASDRGDDADWYRPSEHDRASDAQEDFYRGAADGVSSDGRDWGLAYAGRGAAQDSAKDARRTRWWTEDVERPYRDGERVKATRATGGTFISHVPKGTEGRITTTRLGALGGEYATVEFDNGYVEEVPLSDIERGKSWWQ